MIDESLLKNHNIGKDGFSWWLGQVCESKTWEANFPEEPVQGIDELPGFRRRVKVAILGYHTYSKEELTNDDLPWAYCLMPTSAGGGSGGFSESLALTGGEWVFGFFLDGSEGQQPVIIGLFDKSSQEDFRKEIPDIRYAPFSGYTNEKPEPLTSIKQLDTIKQEGTGPADKDVGSGGVKTQSALTNDNASLQQGDAVEVLNQALDYQKKNLEATGDMMVADNSDCVDYQDQIKQVTQRQAKVETNNKETNGVFTDEGLKIGNVEAEKKRTASIIATAQKFIQVNAMAATLEKMGSAASILNSMAPLSQMLKADAANDEAAQKLVGTFAEIISALPLDALNFVNETSGKLVSQPPCVVENYTGALMGKSLGNIDAKINGVMGSVNNVLASVDKANSLATMGMGAAKTLMGGGGISSILSQGLNSLGGVSIGLDGIQKFSSSFKKVYPGTQPLPCPKGKNLSALRGGNPLPPSGLKMANVLEKFAADSTGLSQLTSGISNFTGNNSIFNTLTNLDNTGLADLGGLGGITDALDKAQNLSSFAKFPGTTGNSIMDFAKTALAGGDTFDSVLVGAESIFPGGRGFVKEAFQNQIEGQRFSGSECETGPIASGPPIIEIWGGGGTGATANAVVGPNGNLLAVDVTRPGKGYSTPPFCAVIDRTGVGFGAVIRAEIDEKKVEETGSSGVTKIVVVEGGWDYLPSPDGSVGGNGVKFADADNTVIKDKEGRFLPFKPNRGVTIPPGGTVYLPVGSVCQLPTSARTTDGDPVFESGQKKPGKIKSLQVNLKKGFKGFAKVTDGSRPGAGPILSIRDVVNDRKISNLIEVQTGNPWNIDYQPENILKLYSDKNITAKKGSKELTRFGQEGVDPKANDKEWVRQQYHELFCREPDAAGWRHWLGDLQRGESRAKVLANMKIATPEYATRQAKIKSGEINPEDCKFRWKTTPATVNSGRYLDPWMADLEVGTILTFRGVFNHHQPLTASQLEDPYDLTRGNYRYFVFDYVVEVTETSMGYPWAIGIDQTKTKWYKLNEIKYVTGTEDFVNGETVTKRCRDYAGRLYELNITVCTYDDDTIEVQGHGLSTNSEGFEVVRTPVLCEPPITSDKHANYQPVRWYRPKLGGNKKYDEGPGTIPGSEKNTLAREIVKVYNSFGDKKYGYAYKHGNVQGRQYADQGGLNHWIKDYLNALKQTRKGLSCETEEYTVVGSKGQSSLPIVYSNLAGLRKSNDLRLEYDDDPTGGFDVNGAFTIESTTGGVIATFSDDGNTLNVKGTGTVTLKYNWNDIPGYKSKALDSITIADATWTQANVRRGTEIHTISVNSVSKPDQIKTRQKKIEPITEEEYNRYKNNLNQKPEPHAFNCVKKRMYEAAKINFEKYGQVTKEETYCEWAREYVDEVQKVFKPTNTIGYELPCGGEITTPEPKVEKPKTTTYPTVLEIDDVVVNSTGAGYNPGDGVTFNGENGELILTPDGAIIGARPPKLGPLLDYPVVRINSDTGAGADLECTLKTVPVDDDAELLPSQIVEVIDCVGKNIFIKES